MRSACLNHCEASHRRSRRSSAIWCWIFLDIRTSLIASRRNSGRSGGLIRGTSHLLAIVIRRKPSGARETGGARGIGDVAARECNPEASTVESTLALRVGAGANLHQSTALTQPDRTRTSRLAGGARPPHPPENSEVWRRGRESCEWNATSPHSPTRPRLPVRPRDPALQRRRDGRPAPLATNSRVASTGAAGSATPPGLLTSDTTGRAARGPVRVPTRGGSSRRSPQAGPRGWALRSSSCLGNLGALNRGIGESGGQAPLQSGDLPLLLARY